MRKRCKIAIWIALGVTLLLLHVAFQKTTSQNAAILIYKRLQKDTQATETGANTCGSDLALVYLKTHKTGSSTLMRILNRYKRRSQVRSQINTFPTPFVGGYPGLFRRDFCIVNSSSTLQAGHRVDYLMDHFRFQKEEVQAVMNPSAKYITIMRNPLQQFESSFMYYYANYADGKKIGNGITCHRQPYLHVTNGRWVNFSQYVALAETSLNESAPWFFRSRNYQAFDLGLDPLDLNEEYILHKAKELDDTFHLVLILDHLLESLILLKDLLCLNWEDIIPPPPRNAASYKDHTFTEREKMILRKLTRQDQILYDYFNASLWRKVDAYGRQRMAREVATLRKNISRTRAKNKKKKKRMFSPPSLEDLPQRAKTDQQSETKILEARLLLKRSGRKTAKSERVTDIARYMVENYGWCPT